MSISYQILYSVYGLGVVSAEDYNAISQASDVRIPRSMYHYRPESVKFDLEVHSKRALIYDSQVEFGTYVGVDLENFYDAANRHAKGNRVYAIM